MRWLLVIPIFCISLFIVQLQAQNNWQAATILLEGKNIKDLNKLGIAFDHGHYHPGESFSGDFTQAEIEKIQKAGFKIELNSYNDLHFRSVPTECKPNQSPEPAYQLPSNYPYGSMNGYLDLQELYETLELMEAFYPNLITFRTPIGNFRTQEGRQIFYVKISDNPKIDEDEPEILYTALHHAREPASMSQLIFFMWYVLENYQRDSSIRNLVNNRELYFVPCVNPDGYAYNEETEPSGGGFWRKNRNPNADDIGVDLNRNYGLGWGFDDDGSSPLGNNDTYRGTAAFSEIETQALKHLCEQRNFNIALNYHSHGDLLIIPWGYLNVMTEDSLLYFEMAESMTKYNKFKVGTSNQTLNYSVNGVSDDWMYGEETTKNKIFSFTPEVGYAFWPDRKDIYDINHSTQYMNFISAWNAGECAHVTELSPFSISTDTASLLLNVVRTGVENDLITINIQSNYPELTFDKQSFELNLGPGETREISLAYRLNKRLSKGDSIQFTVQLNTGHYNQTLNFSKAYYGNPNWEEQFINVDHWFSPGQRSWEITSESFFSAPNCLTDSPNEPMEPNVEKTFQNSKIIHLEQANYAFLRFKARWQMDYETDYAQILVSKDGIDFDPLCGLYTRAGTFSQAFDEPVYCGEQNEWVTEWIDLHDYLGHQLFLKAYMYSGLNEAMNDGIYIDDIEVFTNLVSGNTTIDESELIQIYPVPARGWINVSTAPYLNDQNLQLTLTNSAGITESISYNKQQHSLHLDVRHFTPGIYILTINLSSGIPVHKKVLIH